MSATVAWLLGLATAIILSVLITEGLAKIAPSTPKFVFFAIGLVLGWTLPSAFVAWLSK